MISQVKIYVMDIVWILCDVVCILQVFWNDLYDKFCIFFLKLFQSLFNLFVFICLYVQDFIYFSNSN